jgi:hypothetical protein
LEVEVEKETQTVCTIFYILTWIYLMAGVYSVKRDVISRTVFSLRDVTSSVPRSCIGCKNTAESFLLSETEILQKQKKAEGNTAKTKEGKIA